MSQYLQQDILIQGEHYPHGLYVGELRHPKCGRLFPAIVSSKCSSLLIKYQSKNVDEVAHLCEDLVGHFTLSLIKHQFPKVYVIEQSLQNRFPNMMKLNLHHNVSILNKRDDIEKFISMVIDTIQNRNCDILDAEIVDVYEYNKNVDPRAQEEYILAIINLNDYADSVERLDMLSELLDGIYTSGIKFVMYFNQDEFNDYLQGIDDVKKQQMLDTFMKKVLVKIPIIELKEVNNQIALFFDEKEKLFGELNQLIKQNHLSVELSTRPVSKSFHNTLHTFNDVILKNIKQIYHENQASKPQPFLEVEVGVSLNGKEKRYFELGSRNQAFHAFMIGMNGTGKTTLLDHIIKGIANQFTPEQVELYLFDYKEGVEFKKYANLPHARVVMLDNRRVDIIFDVLHKFHDLIEERGELFRQINVKNIDEYNQKAEKTLARSYLVIDEVQCLFEHPQASSIEKLLIDLAKRGRAFGLHMIMSTQTLTGYTISSELLTQFKMRVAFTVDVFDSMKIFMVGNETPVYLKPFEFILNDGMGVKESNQNVLMNKPVSDDIIQKISQQYSDVERECLVIDENQNIDIHKQKESNEDDTPSTSFADFISNNLTENVAHQSSNVDEVVVGQINENVSEYKNQEQTQENIEGNREPQYFDNVQQNTNIQNDSLKVEIGVSLDGQEKRYFELGFNNRISHAFIIGMCGTGKTILLDHIIKGIVTQFTPKQAKLYLFDFCGGGEFKKYEGLPHARFIHLGEMANLNIIHNILNKFQDMMVERSALFRRENVVNIDEYNKKSDHVLSKNYLFVDEAWSLFQHPDFVATERLLMDVMLRGITFGLHIIMSTQTLIGYTINPHLFNLFRMRIAFTVDSFDAMKIFTKDNEAPVGLRPFECILNDRMGVKEFNQHILVHKPQSDELIQVIAHKYKNLGNECVVIDQCGNNNEMNNNIDSNHIQSVESNFYDSQSSFESFIQNDFNWLEDDLLRAEEIVENQLNTTLQVKSTIEQSVFVDPSLQNIGMDKDSHVQHHLNLNVDQSVAIDPFLQGLEDEDLPAPDTNWEEYFREST